jgi:hypothetical protein
MIGSLAWSVSRDQVVRPAPFNAPLFTSLIEGVPEDRRWVVLDLGAVCPQVIALFGGHRCRVDIADLSQGLELLDRDLDRESLRHVAESVLPLRRAEPADLVLCWDLLNYLNRAALKTLMAQIAERARPGTLVHALIHYADAQMPEHPGHYVPQPDGSLINVAPQSAIRTAPRYSPEDLRLNLPAYRIERAMLLGNGMQEFLLRV